MELRLPTPEQLQTVYDQDLKTSLVQTLLPV